MTTSSAEVFAAKSALLDRLCVEVGRDPRQIARSVAVGCAVEQAPSALDTTGWLVGAPDDLARGLQALREVGVERVMLGDYGQLDETSLEAIAADVMPKLQ